MKLFAVGQFFKATPVILTLRRCQTLADGNEIESGSVECRVSSVGFHDNSKLKTIGVMEWWSNDSEHAPLFQHSIVPSFHSSSVTNRTACKALDLVLLHKFLPKDDLIRRRLPIHVEDLLSRPNKLLRIAVTLQAPLHI